MQIKVLPCSAGTWQNLDLNFELNLQIKLAVILMSTKIHIVKVERVQYSSIEYSVKNAMRYTIWSHCCGSQ